MRQKPLSETQIDRSMRQKPLIISDSDWEVSNRNRMTDFILFFSRIHGILKETRQKFLQTKREMIPWQRFREREREKRDYPKTEGQ